jgi:hypothetical protein
MGVQVEANDVAEAGVCSSMSAPAGYSEDTDVGLVLLLVRVRLLLVHSVEAPSRWDPGDVALRENGLLSQRLNIRVQEARVMVYRWQFCASLLLAYSSS